MSWSEALLNPRRIALIGASSDAKRLTARAQIYLRRHGFDGDLFPVNPRADTVLGEPAFPSLEAVPGGPVDLAYILVGTQHVESSVEACAAAGARSACILADGFAEAGPAGRALQDRVVAAARAGGLRLLGPNSMGVINVPSRTACSVNAALAAEKLLPGRWSLVSQSGSVMGTLVSRAEARGLGFAKLIGTGNEADLTAGELAAALVDDPETDAILLFLETIRDPERLEEAARRAHAAGKPVIAYKLGRSEMGAQLAATHTGALAGADAAVDAFLRAAGIIRVDMLETLLELPPLLLGRRPPEAPKRAVEVVTTTGGGGAMVVDRLGLAGIAAHMKDVTLAGASRASMGAAIAEARSAPDADLAIAVVGSSAQFQPHEAVAGVTTSTGALPVCAFLVPQADVSLRLMAEAGIAAFRTPEACADAVRAYLDWRAPRAVPDAPHDPALAALIEAALDEPGARAVFAALGVPNSAMAVDPDDPPPLTYPVALKAVSAEIAHKTESGAVALNVADAAALRAAATDMRVRLGGQITGFIAQPMAKGLSEAILGYRRDPVVGPMVALGAGGVLAEITRDVVLRVAPVSEAEAREMIEEVRAFAAIRGYRNLPRGDLSALASAVAAVSRLVAYREVSEAEINPLIVLLEGQGVVMADALIARAERHA
ncbi:acetate--CoA ligase family protein [Muricoccus radiodurans]|uniref:acetate--CoA ligase family protein n=1 Tax=Muricoccus radiodurans TaxID=2231721 RepID=UPI003CEC68B1